MSSKTVKVTNGKIINYKITAPGYKTIYGSQLITADGTITKNMVPETSADGVYSLGDRIGNIATFVCYFNSTNPETLTDQKYAVFVLDAKYRNHRKYWGGRYTLAPIPTYSAITITNNHVIGLNESATYNTTTILGFGASSDISYPAFEYARNAATLPSLNIQSQLPNAEEIYQIYLNRELLDSLDPTLSDYSGYALTPWTFDSINGMWTSNQYNAAEAWYLYHYEGPRFSHLSKEESTGYGDGIFGVVPVFEIPVN